MSVWPKFLAGMEAKSMKMVITSPPNRFSQVFFCKLVHYVTKKINLPTSNSYRLCNLKMLVLYFV